MPCREVCWRLLSGPSDPVVQIPSFHGASASRTLERFLSICRLKFPLSLTTTCSCFIAPAMKSTALSISSGSIDISIDQYVGVK